MVPVSLQFKDALQKLLNQKLNLKVIQMIMTVSVNDLDDLLPVSPNLGPVLNVPILFSEPPSKIHTHFYTYRPR